jgi:hypothetical protein
VAAIGDGPRMARLVEQQPSRKRRNGGGGVRGLHHTIGAMGLRARCCAEKPEGGSKCFPTRSATVAGSGPGATRDPRGRTEHVSRSRSGRPIGGRPHDGRPEVHQLDCRDSQEGVGVLGFFIFFFVFFFFLVFFFCWVGAGRGGAGGGGGGGGGGGRGGEGGGGGGVPAGGGERFDIQRHHDNLIALPPVSNHRSSSAHSPATSLGRA